MKWRVPATCWEKDAARLVLNPEAEAGNQAVFLASHAPLPIKRMETPDATDGHAVDEETVLEAVLEDGNPIVPILGPSGCGKSHLVRWLRHRLDRDPQPDLVVIFVPKHDMSLRRIVERILDHGVGPEFEELREAVDGATSGLTSERIDAISLRLRSALANLVQLDGARSRPDENEATRGMREFLARGLPAALHDSHIEQYFLRPGAPIHRLALEKVNGRDRDADEKEFAFSPADLNLKVSDVARASHAAKQAVGHLVAKEDNQALAARMLNEQLERAVQEVFGLGGTTIEDVFVRLRRQLRAQNRRILLLIEDFSVFGGVEGGIINAITLMPTESQEGSEICELRTVMAVTSGYFANSVPDTVKTRTHCVFDLSSTEGFQPDVERFAAGYLNAARVGPKMIEALGAGNVPNACDDCAVRDACHDAFGASDGMGLFPLSSALVRNAAAKMHGGFVARDYLTRVLRPILVDAHNDVEQGLFPTTKVSNEFRYINADFMTENVSIAARVEGQDGDDNRRAAIARLYADPHRMPTPWPSESVYKAFGVVPPGSLPMPDSSVVKDVGAYNGVSVSPESDPDEELIRALRIWKNTGDIPDRYRRKTLEIVIDTIEPRLRLDDGRGGERLWARGIPPLSIESAALETDAGAGEAGKIVICRTDETIRALAALIRFRRCGAWDQVGGEARRYTEVEIAAWRDAALHHIIRVRELEAELPHLVAALRADAWGRGSRPAFSTDPVEVLAAVVATEPPAATATTSEDLQKLLNGWKGQIREDLTAQLLRTVGYSQGGGDSRVVDGVALLDALAAAPALPDPSRLPTKISGFATQVSALLGPRRLAARLNELESRLPDLSGIGDDAEELVIHLDATLSQLSAYGKLPAVAVPLKDLGQRVSDLPVRIARLRDLAARISALDPADPSTVLQALSSVDLADAELVRGWLIDCDRVLTAVEEKLATEPVSSPLEPARKELTAALDRLGDAVAGAIAGGAR